MRLHDFLDYWARERPEGELAVHGDRMLRYGEGQAEVHRLANAFVDGGLGIGDRVAVLAKNSIEYALVYFAASKAGVVPVLINYRLAPPEWAYIVGDAGAKVVLVGGSFVEAADGLRDALPGVERWIALDGPAPPGWETYPRWVAGHSTAPPERDVTPEHDAYQMYTSGTTGRPKGAVLTHRAVTANIGQITHAIRGRPGERSLVVAPMFHAGAVFNTLCAVSWGGALYIHHEFNPGEVVRALSEERVGFAVLVAAMLQACLVAVPDVAERRYDDLRLILYGASPIAKGTLRRALDVFGCDFVQAYGMTEASVALSFLLPDDHRRALADRPELLLSGGRAVLGTELRVVDERDRPVPSGRIGEIVARGPQLMRGYWNRAEESAATLRGGWLHTGDAGVLDAAGYVYVQDRVKDMIVSGGENVYPRAVEDVLLRHPAIADAAVIGVPDERWGEAVKAVVVLRDGMAASAEEIVEFCRGKLGGFELPRSVDFADALPRTPTGKVLKRALRAPYWIGQARRVGGA